MALYTTGEIAKKCGVTVRTVQYYDTRGILSPSELSEGGRRMYAETEVKRLETICLLRELGLSINVIGQLLKEEDPGSVIDLLLEQQGQALRGEIAQRQTQLDRLTALRRGLREMETCSIEAIGDVARNMENRTRLHRLYFQLLMIGVAMEIFELTALLLGVLKGIWWPTALWGLTFVPFCVLFTRVYFGRVAYVCPKCHETFRANKREALFANHTLRTRRLTCPACSHKGFCVEVWGGDAAGEPSA